MGDVLSVFLLSILSSSFVQWKSWLNGLGDLFIMFLMTTASLWDLVSHQRMSSKYFITAAYYIDFCCNL